MAPTPWSVRPYLSSSHLAGSMDASLLPQRNNSGTQTEAIPVCNAAKALLKGKWSEFGGDAHVTTAIQDIAEEKKRQGPHVGLLLEPKDFAAMQRMVGDGVIGQAFFKAFAAWAWALLKKEHDPEFPAEE